MVLKNYLKASSLLLLSLIVSSCASWPKLTQIEVQTVEVERNIPIQNRPQQLNLSDITWYVVTKENFEEFKKRYEKENGLFLFYAFSVRDYETLALNMADIKRYIEQQKQIIIYYEKAIVPEKEEKKYRMRKNIRNLTFLLVKTPAALKSSKML